MVDPELRALVAPFLEKGERVEWAARPRLSRYTKGSWWLSLLGLPFFGFALVWEIAVIGGAVHGEGLAWFMAIFGIPFLGIGGLMLFQPLILRRKAQRTLYAITDRRALLMLTGRKPEARGYPGSALTVVSVDPQGDVFFTSDRHVDRFLLQSGAGKGGPFNKVGFYGVEDVERVRERLEALRREDTDMRESRRSTTAEALLEFKGAYAASQAKLESFLQARADEAAAAERQNWRRYVSWVVGAVAVHAALMFAMAMNRANQFDMLILGCFMGLFVVIGSAIGYFATRRKNEAAVAVLDRGRALAGAIARFAADAHPKTRMHGWIDLGDAGTTRPYRMANSHSSNALKTYHKHHWIRLVFATADGSKLAFSVVDRVKLKSGVEVERHRQLRGRLEVNPALYDVQRFSERFNAWGLEIFRVHHGEKTMLYFGGGMGEPSDLPEKLAALYRNLPKKAGG